MIVTSGVAHSGEAMGSSLKKILRTGNQRRQSGWKSFKYFYLTEL